jgi:cytochrome c553
MWPANVCAVVHNTGARAPVASARSTTLASAYTPRPEVPLTRPIPRLTLGVLCGVMAAGALRAQAPTPAPDWAYGYLQPVSAGDRVAPPCPPSAKAFDCAYPSAPLVDDGVRHHLEGTPLSFTKYQAYVDYGPADWYPDDHPAMPAIVAKGKEADRVRACALCHYPNGQGKMENAGVAGLPAGYILQQLKAFATGARRSADPRKANTNEMARIAASLTEAEAQAAAGYFAAMPWRPWTRVVEAETAPAVRATVNGLFLPVADAPRVALGRRIIEMPERPERTDTMRDPRSGFVAYVPMGSIAKGAALVASGGGKTAPCGICHGSDLKGLGNVPGIAGRTASYTMRQLWDMKQGTRKAPLMTSVVAALDVDDMIAVTAYAASQTP